MEETVDSIRQLSRQSLFLQRRRLRDEKTDEARSVSAYSSQEYVSEIANKLKTKTSISAEELRLLKNALFDDEKNTAVILNTHGALRGLVREFTGNDIEKQCAAAGCLCNMALADEKACFTLAKAVGSYLVTALDSSADELAMTSAWTVGNLCGGSMRVCAVLAAQGAVGALGNMAAAHTRKRHAALSTLAILVYTAGDRLSDDHLNKIIESLPQDITIDQETSQLLFYLSCHEHFQNYPQGIVHKLLENFVMLLENGSNAVELRYVTRTLANLNNREMYEVLLKELVDRMLIVKVKQQLYGRFSKDFCWLFGNMLDLCGSSEFFNMLLVE